MEPLHLNREWLASKYLDEGLSTYAIGRIVGRDPKSIHRKLVDFGIPRRPKWHRIATDCNASILSPRRGWNHTDEAKEKMREASSHPRPDLRGSGNPMHGLCGPLHPNWKGGSTPERQRVYASAEWAVVVRAVHARERYLCQRCGATNTKARMKDPSTLHLHHVKGWSEFPDLRLAPDNIALLCATCHRWVHSRKNTSGEWLG